MWVLCRRSWTVQKPMKDFMSSVGTNAQGSRWHITMKKAVRAQASKAEPLIQDAGTKVIIGPELGTIWSTTALLKGIYMHIDEVRAESHGIEGLGRMRYMH